MENRNNLYENNNMYSDGYIKKKKHSKVLTVIIIFVLCAFVAVIAIGFLFMRENQLNKQQAEYYATILDEMMSKKISIVENAEKHIGAGQEQDIQSYIDSLVKLDKKITIAYMTFEDNTNVVSGGWYAEGVNFTEKSWYVDAKNNPGNIYISEPYFDEYEGLCIAITKAVIQNDRIIGVCGIDINIDDIVQMTDESNEKGNYVIIATYDGQMVVYPDRVFSLSSGNAMSLSRAGYSVFEESIGKTELIMDYHHGMKLATCVVSDFIDWKVIYVSSIFKIIGATIIICFGALVLSIVLSIVMWRKK